MRGRRSRMADKVAEAVPEDKRGGYSGSKPGETMRPPVKVPSNASQNGSKGNGKS